MTSAERVAAAMSHREADRVPLLLALTTHGARELGLSIREYFSEPAAMVEGQLRMQARYGHDFLGAFSYASLELEAWGGETLYRDDGPPNAGAPIVQRPEQILSLRPPEVKDARCLRGTLEVLAGLKASGRNVPVTGTVMAPFSLPVMQLGFERYFQVMFERPELLDRLMRVNEEFCVDWANSQLRAGADAIVFFDPCSSPTITPPQFARKTGFAVARRTISRIEGPVLTHFGSGQCLGVIDDLCATGTVGIGSSSMDDLRQLKDACRGRLLVVGNLNGIEMRRWSAETAEAQVKQALAAAAPGGGFVLSDTHGEIPWQVPEEVLSAIAQAARRWGSYPLNWIEASVPP